MAVAYTNAFAELDDERKDIEERQHKLEEIQFCEKELDDVKKKLSKLEEKQQSLLQSIENGVVDKRDVDDELEDLERLIQEYTYTRSNLETRYKDACALLPVNTKINKHQVLKNIRSLMKIKDVKVGQVEKEAGSSPGYMARLERDGNTTSPTLEFVATAAEMLGVNMEVIVRGNIEELSSTDMYMLEFLSELMMRTDTGEVRWKREDIENGKANPFVNKINTDSVFDEDRYEFQSAYYNLAYVDDKRIPVSSLLPGGDSRLFIIPVIGDVDSDSEPEEFKEVYLIDKKNNKVPIYNTHDCNKAVALATDTLYKSAFESSKGVNLDSYAKHVIDSFMATKR